MGAYLACGGIAVGSVGPWGADIFGYSGIGNNGSLTLLAAGLAAFAVWRWTTSMRKSAAIATLTAGALCAAVAVHDMLDIRDTFGGSNDLAWIEGVGWGLGLVFLSGVALALLSLPLLRRGRAAKHPGFHWKQSALLAGIAAMFWSACRVSRRVSRSALGRSRCSSKAKAASSTLGTPTRRSWRFGRERRLSQ